MQKTENRIFRRRRGNSGVRYVTLSSLCFLTISCGPANHENTSAPVELPAKLNGEAGWQLKAEGVWERTVHSNHVERYYQGAAGLKQALHTQQELLRLLQDRELMRPSSESMEQLERHQALVDGTQRSIQQHFVHPPKRFGRSKGALTLAEQEGPEPGCSLANDVFLSARAGTTRLGGNLNQRGSYSNARARFADRCAPLTQTATVYTYAFAEADGVYEVSTCGPTTGTSVYCSSASSEEGERHCLAHGYSYVAFPDGSARELSGLENRCAVDNVKYCHIDENTYRHGELHPTNPCLVCDTGSEFYSWSANTTGDGSQCDPALVESCQLWTLKVGNPNRRTQIDVAEGYGYRPSSTCYVCVPSANPSAYTNICP